MELNAVNVGFIAAIAAFIGVVVSSVFALLSSYLSNISEERKHNRALVMEMGFEYWKIHLEAAKEKTRTNGGEILVPPPEGYILFMLRLWEDIFSKKLSKVDIAERLKSAQDAFDLDVDERNSTRWKRGNSDKTG